MNLSLITLNALLGDGEGGHDMALPGLSSGSADGPSSVTVLRDV